MLIDTSYFTGLLDVGLSPCPGTPTATNEAEAERLENYIAAYEPEYLEKLLGEELYNDFSTYLEREEGEAEEARWEDLKKLLQGTPSPVACYVYFKYVGEVNVSVTRQGVTTFAGEDAVSPAGLQRRAWNMMASMNLRIYAMLQNGAYEGVKVNRMMMRKLNALGL